MAGQNNGFIPYGRFKLQTGHHEALARRTLQHEALGQKNNSFRTSIWFEKSLKLTRTYMLPVHGFVVPFSGLPILVCCFWFHVCFGFRENRKTSFFPTVCLPVLRLGKTGGLQGYCMANEASHHSLCLCIGRYTSGCRRPIHIHPHVY